ncbi:MAG: folylpolyglutamate synthase/dihydrofolate synthase family protein [Bacteroidales bacterium]
MVNNLQYQETLDYLYSRLPMYQRIGKAAYKADLSTTRALDNYFNHPHKKFRSIHVAGTNGKGSVSHMLASVLHSAGYRTGLYTSPHLKDFRERIRVDGEPVDKKYVVDFVDHHQPVFDELSPSFFEMTVAMAFDYFAKKNVDITVVETGMGGRLDSTNIITPMVSVITNIGMDHTEFLGSSLSEIAVEKAGIIKPDIPVVIGELQEETRGIFMETASRLKSEISFASKTYKCDLALQTVRGMQSLYISRNGRMTFDKLETDLQGFYQKKNVITALQVIDILTGRRIKISRNDIYRGLRQVASQTGLFGRWQTIGINPTIICDTAHNAEGFNFVVKQIDAIPHHKLHMVIGFVNDKNTERILEMLPRDAAYYFTMASIPRALDSAVLQKKALTAGLRGNNHKTVSEALSAARNNAGKKDLIFIGGSTFVVAEVIH